MKKISAISVIICIFLLTLSACTGKKEESLAFIDETKTEDGSEKESVPVKEPEKPVSFSKDMAQESHYDFWCGSGKYYFKTVGYGESGPLYEADPVSMTYRPLCKKEGCLHNDDGCYARLIKNEKGTHTDTLQLYGDGIYEPVVRETGDGSGVLEYLKIDPNGRKPKQTVWEIPLDGLMFTTESYQVFPTSRLHRGYCVIESTKQEEGEKADLKEELGEDTGDGRGYDPSNPFNEMAATRHNDTSYVAVYDLEKKSMQTVFEKRYEGVSYAWTYTIAEDDKLYIIVRTEMYHPVTITAEDGHKDYDVEYDSTSWDIYCWQFGSQEPAEFLFSGKLFDGFSGLWFRNGQMLMLDQRDKTNAPGSRGSIYLSNLDLSTGKVTEIGMIYEESETRDGLAGAYFLDGMILGSKYTEDPRDNNYQENVPQVLTIFNLNAEKEIDLRFNEDLPTLAESYRYGPGIGGTDGQALYCNNSTKDREIFYIIPLNGDPVQYFTPAETGNEDFVSPTETVPEETGPAVYEDEDFPEQDQTVTGMQVASAQDDDNIYFPYPFGSGLEFCFCAADKKSGKISVLCNLPDCSHFNTGCEAYAGGHFDPYAMTLTNRRLYTAVNETMMSSSIVIRAYDFDTKEWSEIASVDLKKAGINKDGYSMQNWQAFFHKDCFYYYVVRAKQSGGGSDPNSWVTTEMTAMIYEIPLRDPSSAHFILNEDYPTDDINNIWLKAAGCQDRILYTVYGCRYSYEEVKNDSGETDYLSYAENPLLEIGACSISTGSREILLEKREIGTPNYLYADGDALYYTAYVPIENPEPIGGPVNKLNLYRFDLKSSTDECVKEDITPGDLYAAYFCRDGYVTLRKPTMFDETKSDRLFCAFYDLKGEKIREFDYKMPDSLTVNFDEYKYPVGKYLGADNWNLYFSETYNGGDNLEGDCLTLVYAIPAAGDEPVLFEK